MAEAMFELVLCDRCHDREAELSPVGDMRLCQPCALSEILDRMKCPATTAEIVKKTYCEFRFVCEDCDFAMNVEDRGSDRTRTTTITECPGCRVKVSWKIT